MQYPLEYEIARRYTRMDNRVMNNAKIAERLDEAMRARGVTSQTMLARMSGVSQPTIARLLKGIGKQGPETETLRPLARALSVHLRWLQEGLGPRDLSAPAHTEPHEPPKPITDEEIEEMSAHAADELLKRAAEMLDTYRLASATDRARIDLVIREIRSNLGARNKMKSGPR